MKKFEIDFFEFAFLVEACIPPVPIARSMFFDEVIDEYYFKLSDKQRLKLFNWIIKNDKFDTKEEKCRIFYNRYSPFNQYELKDINNKKHKCFKDDGKYKVKSNTWIDTESIKSVKLITEK